MACRLTDTVVIVHSDSVKVIDINVGDFTQLEVMAVKVVTTSL